MSGTDSSEWAIGQSSCSIASSCGPKCGRRCATKCASARRASSAVTANQRGPSRPTVGRSRASRSARTCSSISSSGGCHGATTPRVALPARRRLAVLVVEVPLPADRLAALHQHVEPAALGAVEVLHPEGLAVARPLRELRARERERRRRQDLGDQPLLLQPLDERERGVRGGLVDDDRPPDPLQRLAVGVGAQVGRAVAQLGGEVAHAREHQVQLLAVEALPAQHPRRLDEHDLAVAVLVRRVHVRAELVGEEPQRLGGHARVSWRTSRPATRLHPT